MCPARRPARSARSARPRPSGTACRRGASARPMGPPSAPKPRSRRRHRSMRSGSHRPTPGLALQPPSGRCSAPRSRARSPPTAAEGCASRAAAPATASRPRRPPSDPRRGRMDLRPRQRLWLQAPGHLRPMATWPTAGAPRRRDSPRTSATGATAAGRRHGCPAARRSDTRAPTSSRAGCGRCRKPPAPWARPRSPQRQQAA
mmetsp:Transcript_25827/g.74377  ORF Transcript_25827/g.74377 Transcript_25827/m.74377 type:complete len:202 (+) Transcript_25827:574-1179(+)